MALLVSDSRAPVNTVIESEKKATRYPLVNVYIAMENHHFQWENPLFLWPFSIAILTQPEGMFDLQKLRIRNGHFTSSKHETYWNMSIYVNIMSRAAHKLFNYDTTIRLYRTWYGMVVKFDEVWVSVPKSPSCIGQQFTSSKLLWWLIYAYI